MANTVSYNQINPFMDIADVRLYSELERNSVELSKIFSQIFQDAKNFPSFSLEENQRKVETNLLVHLAKLDDESDYDEEFLKPSKSATDTTRNILRQAYRNLSKFSLLPEFITADGDGGIRVQWINNLRELRLICSTEGALKLYWQDNDNYGLEESTLNNLTERLEWLKEV